MDTVLVTIGEFVSETGAKAEPVSSTLPPARNIPAPGSMAAASREDAPRLAPKQAPKLRPPEVPRVPLASLGLPNSDWYVSMSAMLTFMKRDQRAYAGRPASSCRTPC
jgi:hypothetical protein